MVVLELGWAQIAGQNCRLILSGSRRTPMAVNSMNGQTFAALLDKAIERSSRVVKRIELSAEPLGEERGEG